MSEMSGPSPEKPWMSVDMGLLLRFLQNNSHLTILKIKDSVHMVLLVASQNITTVRTWILPAS
jgi:hypothetical protein